MILTCLAQVILHLKWITFREVKYSELSLKEIKDKLKALKKQHGGLLRASSWPKEVTLEYSNLMVASYGSKTSPIYKELMSLEQGDKISIRIDDGSKYLFTL